MTLEFLITTFAIIAGPLAAVLISCLLYTFYAADDLLG